MNIPVMTGWNFIRMTTGKPVEDDLATSILKTIDEKGVIDASEMQIGISGRARNHFGYDIQIDGYRNQIIRIIGALDNGNLIVMTSTYNEFICERVSMLSETEANKRIIEAAAEQRRLKQHRENIRENNRLSRGNAAAIMW